MLLILGLDKTEVSLFSAIVAAPAVIGTEAISIVLGLVRVLGNQATKMLSLKIAKHEKFSMSAVAVLNTIGSLISKALSDEPFQMKNNHQSLKHSLE